MSDAEVRWRHMPLARSDFGVGKGVRPGEFAQLGLRFEDAPATGVPRRPPRSSPTLASRS